MPGSLRRFLLQLSLACACGTSNYISSALSLFGTFQNNEIMSLLSSNAVPKTWRRLPIVDVGTNDGTDFTMPGSKVGHRVYSFEPSPVVYARMLRNLQQNGISVANDSVGFRRAKAGTVLPTHAAVSNVTGSAPFLVAERTTLDRSGKASSLSADAIPRGSRIRTVTVPLVTLDRMLAEEDKGLFILKIDSQGHEYHVLQGCVQYIRTHPVYYILLEFYPKGLRAVNIEPLTLLQFLHYELGYQCFDLGRNARKHGAMELSAFVTYYGKPDTRIGSYGRFTDLICVNFAVM